MRAAQARLKANAFAMRTDVKGYHDSIDQHRMLEMISRHIKGNRKAIGVRLALCFSECEGGFRVRLFQVCVSLTPSLASRD